MPHNRGEKIFVGEETGFWPRHCPQHRRYSVGCDQETENDSPSQRLTRSDVRSAPSPACRPLHSCSHRRWYPWLQSYARALLTKKWVRGAVTSGAVTMARNDPNSAACKRHAGQTSDSGCARSSRRSRRGSGAERRGTPTSTAITEARAQCVTRLAL